MPRREEDQLGGLVARIVGAVPEMHAGARAARARSARWRRPPSRSLGSGRVWDNRRMTPRIQNCLVVAVLVGVAALLGVGAALLWRHPPPPVELATGTYLVARGARCRILA